MEPHQFMSRPTLVGAACLAVLVAVLAVWADLPGPAADDLFYVGPAISYAQHGRLYMPLLAGQQFPTREFLIYPAFYQYMLGGWLKVFGISTRSILAFVQVGYLVTGFAGTFLASRLAGRLPAPGWLWPSMIMLGLLVTLGTMGFRPDVWAFGVMLLGFCVWMNGAFVARAAGWFGVGCSLMISPNVLPYAAVLAALLLLWRDRWPARRIAAEIGPLALAAALVAALFMASIQGRWAEFHQAFLFHARRAVLPPLDSLDIGLRRYVNGFRAHPAFFVSLVVCALATARAVAARLSGSPGASRSLACLAALLAAGLLSVAMTWIREELRLFTLVLAAGGGCFWVLLAGGPAARRMAWMGFAAVFAAAAWIKDPLEPRWLPAARPDPDHVREALACVAREPERIFLVDAYMARSVFDYHLPVNARDWEFSMPFPRLNPASPYAIPPSQTWIVAGLTLKMVEPAVVRFVPFSIGPLRLRRMARAFDVYVIDGRLPARRQLGLPEPAGRAAAR